MKTNLLTGNYFETLHEVHDAIVARLDAVSAVPAYKTPEEFAADSFAGGVSYGSTVSGHSELASLKGKLTRKCAHAIVYRLETGRYELTFYIA